MRIELTQNVALRGLSIDQKPTTKQGAQAPNPNRAAYIVFDSHRDAPAGFAVKVSDTITLFFGFARSFWSMQQPAHRY